METVKNMAKGVTGGSSQFEEGHKIPITHQDNPGTESGLPEEPAHTSLPAEDGSAQAYRAAGKLKGKKALITGGDSGIGKATAILFAMEGADSTICYLPEEEEDAQKTKKAVEAAGAKCYLVPTDIRIKSNCETVVKEALDKMGCVNILFNNAAYQMMRHDITEISDEQWHRTFDTNIHPLFYFSKMLVPQMKWGDCVINNASINAYIGRPDLLDYTTTKGAIVSFTRGLANQQVSKGIRVNAVAPGPVLTPLINSTMDDEAQDGFKAPLNSRPAQPTEIASCVVFLAAADSSQLTGQTIHCNGGGFTTS